jgi:hypothetical protein
MAQATTDDPLDVLVHRGEGIPQRAVEYAEGRVRTLTSHSPRQIRRATVVLQPTTGNPGLRPITVHATLDLEGLPVREHAVGDTIDEAVDLVREKLRGRLVRISAGMHADYRPRLRLVPDSDR